MYKVKDVIKNKNFHLCSDLIDRNSLHITSSSISAYLNTCLDVEEEIECVYYWVDHLYRITAPDTINEINTSLNTHNWETFKKYYYIDTKTPYELPTEMAVFTKNTNILIGHLGLNQETFNLITWAEYECG